MKSLKKVLYLFTLISLSWGSNAQDIHWTQFNHNPIFQNPGNAGQFNGDIRFTGNYKDQWRSVTVPFNTLAAAVDTKLRNNQKVGVGFSIFHDVVGDGSFRTIELQGNISYLIKLSSDSMHTIRPGLNIGMNHRQLNFDQFNFDNQFDGISYNPALSTGELLFTDRKTNLSIGAGAIYQYYKTERFNFTGGIGVYNINKPNQGFYTDVVNRDVRFDFFGKGIYKLNYDWDLVPGINVYLQGKYRELMLGSSVKYTLVDRLGEYRAVYAGVWYRNKDAASISLGMDYQTWFVGVSYDINFSSLVPASHARGGLEIAIRYIMNRFKPKKIIHRICPDYI